MKKQIFYAAFLFCLCALYSHSQFNDGWYLYDFSKSIRATETAGAGINASRSTPQIYAGLRISEGVTPDFEPPSDALVVLTPLPKQKKTLAAQEKIPVWYDVKKQIPKNFLDLEKNSFRTQQ